MKILAWPAFRKEAANPHAALLYRELRRLGVDVDDWTPARACLRHADLWHLHHPDTVIYRRSRLYSLLGTLLFCALLSLARLRGTRILWTVHDLDSNDGLHRHLEPLFWRMFLPRVDAYVCLTEGSRDQVHRRFPELERLPGFVVPHGHYRDAYPSRMSREEARRELGLPPEAIVLLHFGLMRPYKNVPHLIATFRELADDDCILLVAGEPYDGAVEQEVRRAAEGCPRVRLLLRWIPPDEVQRLFAASGLVVLPYRRVLNSGVTTLALSLGRPVLAPDKGTMRDQQRRFGSEWVRLYRGDLSAAVLRDAIAWTTDGERSAQPDLAGLDWATLARQTHQIYETLLASSAQELACRPGAGS